MKDYKCAHCAHCNEIKYDGFFCEKTGYLERKRIMDKCRYFEADTIDRLAKLVTEKLISAYPNGAVFTAVRHGRWECGGICSECGLDNEERKTTYCPNCGARMDGGADK